VKLCCSIRDYENNSNHDETTVSRPTADDEDDDAQEEDEEDIVSARAGDWQPDFHWITEHVAVGGCFPAAEAVRMAREHRIRAVVDLRAEDRDDEQQLRAAGIDLLHLPTPDLEPASAAMLDEGVRFVAERTRRGEKVLIHCEHGIGRSALLALCVLVDQGWDPLDALIRAKEAREAVSPSRSQYDGWGVWLASRGLTAPDYHTFGCIAYRHVAKD
jgi:predicted protein tyrosine phosphatase